ncbi:MAG: PAS domain S-box protein [Desulfobacteraceae bacterium]|nr:PAS domain S-box protein [Desulfobacteraceae bacterium]
MGKKPTYEELEQRVKELEERADYFEGAEKALWESKGTFRAIYRASDSISFVATDLGVEGNDLQITSFSPGAEKMFGYTEHEVIGKSIAMFLLSEDIEKAVPKIREVIKKKKGYEGEITLIRKSGEHFPAFLAIHPLFDSKGNISGGLGISIDISENKNRQSKLHQAAKMESLGTLARGIAHDFNNILGIIIGNTELAIDEIPRWNPVRQNLEKAHKACLRLKDLVKQIRTFSQQTEPKMTPTRVTPIIEETIKFLRSSIPSTVEIYQDILGDSDVSAQ